MDARHEPTLAELLGPYRDTATAEATGQSRQTVHRWRTGRALPETSALPALAEFLRVDLADLTRLIAAESTRQKAAVA